MSKPATLVCARADARFTIAGSSFDRCCSRCNQRVMLSPSGKVYLERYTEAQLICTDCIIAEAGTKPVKTLGLAAPDDVAADELTRIVPNTWGLRN
jgi:hypothetical protein